MYCTNEKPPHQKKYVCVGLSARAASGCFFHYTYTWNDRGEGVLPSSINALNAQVPHDTFDTNVCFQGWHRRRYIVEVSETRYRSYSVYIITHTEYKYMRPLYISYPGERTINIETANMPKDISRKLRCDRTRESAYATAYTVYICSVCRFHRTITPQFPYKYIP